MPNTNSRPLARLSEAVRRLFRPPRSSVIVVGVDARVRLLATELGRVGIDVSILRPATDPSVRSEAPPGVMVIHSTKLGALALERAGARSAKCLVAATADEALNLSVAREASVRFGVPMVIARLKLPEGAIGWARLNEGGLVRLIWRDVVRAMLSDTEPNAGLSQLASVCEDKQIIDVEMLSPAFAGRKVGDLPLNGSKALALTRDGYMVGDLDAVEVRMGDVISLVGTTASLKQTREFLSSL